MRQSKGKWLTAAVFIILAVCPVSVALGTTNDVHEGKIQVELTEGSSDSSTEESSTQESSEEKKESTTPSSSSTVASPKKNGSFLKANEAVSYMGSFIGALLLIFSLYFIRKQRGVNKK